MGAMSDVMIAEALRADSPDMREYSVVVAPDMRELYRQVRAGRGAAPVPTVSLLEPVAEPSALVAKPPLEDVPGDAEPVALEGAGAAPESPPAFWAGAPVSDQRLRRDGQRPLHFRGMLITAGTVESRLASGARICQGLALWGQEDGGAILEITLEAVETPVLRPLHRLSIFPGADALDTVLSSHDPGDAFPDVPFMTAPALADIRRDAEQLRRDFLKLAGLALGALPNSREIDKEPTK